MTSDSQMMRKVLNLVESATVTEEVLLEGWLDSLKNKFSKNKQTPSARDQGDAERTELKDKLSSEWETWLGRTHRDGSLNDMIRFMTHRIGFKDTDIDAVINRSGVLKGEDVNQVEKKATAGPDDKPMKPKDQMKQPGFDSEAGIPLPTDPNAKLSDYGDTKESRIAEADEKVAPEDQVLSPDMAEKILDLCAAVINDEYLYNGPENDKIHAGSKTSEIPSNVRHPTGKGQYDSKEANDVLKALGVSDADVKRLTNKAAKITKLGDLSRSEQEKLVAIAVALLRSRS